MKNKSLYIFIVCIFFFSCEKVIDIHFDQQKKMVLNAILTNDEMPKIYITESIIPNEPKEVKYIKNAIVMLYEDGNKLADLSYFITDSIRNIGYYTNTMLQIKANHIYKIIVTHPGFPSIESTDKIPNSTNANNYVFSNFPIYVTQNDSSLVKLEFQIYDNGNEKNKYQLLAYYIVKKYVKLSANDSVLRDFTNYTFIQKINNESTLNNYGNYFLDDVDFNGQTKNYSIEFNKYFDYDETAVEVYIWLAIRQYSHPYFKNEQSMQQYYNALSNNVTDSPVWLYSNVNGGYGLLFSSSVKYFTYQLK